MKFWGQTPNLNVVDAHETWTLLAARAARAHPPLGCLQYPVATRNSRPTGPANMLCRSGISLAHSLVINTYCKYKPFGGAGRSC